MHSKRVVTSMLLVCMGSMGWSAEGTQIIENPYANVNWDKVEYIHSMSHQHGKDPEVFWAMGYRHLPLSNYYPSDPFYPLPASFVAQNPKAIAGHNAEQHSCPDLGIHFNAIGSYYATGYGAGARYDTTKSPVEYTFEGLTIFDAKNAPWRGVYRLDLFINSNGEDNIAAAELTIDGALQAKRDVNFSLVGNGTINKLPLTVKGPRTIYFRTLTSAVKVSVNFDPNTTRVTRFRLMQGTNLPWRKAFQNALDGVRRNEKGVQIEGLFCPDGGGITINHPGIGVEKMLMLLDFDPRVLGCEVYNHHRRFGGKMEDPNLSGYYDHWDGVLKEGRRCWGFFVKDHCRFGAGRNILLCSNLDSMNKEEQECEAMRAYRQGRFFGSVAASAVNESGKVTMPYDYSEFYFKRIAVRNHANGKPAGLEVIVDGADPQKRPNTHIRFITDKGVVTQASTKAAYYPFPRGADGKINCGYVRVEAYAYPDTCEQGKKQLTPALISQMSVGEIVNLHDRVDNYTSTEIFVRNADAEPIIITDMIFSQPIMIR